MPRPMAVADLLSAVFKGKPAERRLDEGKIWLVWKAAVGPQIAARAWPVSVRDGILTVAVSSPPWMQQIGFLKKGIVEKINGRLGCDLVRDIFLKAGVASPKKQAPQPSRPQRHALTEEDARLIDDRTASISDPELREAFARILTRDRESRPATES